MALYRLAAKVGKGGSSTFHYDYICRQGKYSNGDKAEELIYYESQNMPTWAESSRDFWREQSLKNEGYRKIELALPVELDYYEQVELVQDFCEQTFGENHAYTFAIHDNIGELSDVYNPHVHIMVCERKIDHNRPEPDRENYFKRGGKKKDGTLTGGYRKCRDMTGKNRKEWLIKARERWAVIQNKHLERAGAVVRVDHRTLKEQGIDRPHQKHLGPKLSRMKTGEKYAEYRAIKDDWHAIAELAEIEEKERNLAIEKARLEAEADELRQKIADLEHAEKERNQMPPETDRKPGALSQSMGKVAIYSNGVYKAENGKFYELSDMVAESTKSPGQAIIIGEPKYDLVLKDGKRFEKVAKNLFKTNEKQKEKGITFTR